MRLRRHYKSPSTDIKEHVDSKKEPSTEVVEINTAEKAERDNNAIKAKAEKGFNPRKLVRNIVNNPNFNMQLILILLTFTSDNMQMDRGIDGMTGTIDKIKNITEMVNSSMTALKGVAEVPQNIKRILK